jgi:hypothetical protein
MPATIKDEQLGWGYATSCCISIEYQGPLVAAPKRKEGYLNIYKCYLIDTRKEEIIRELSLVGKDEADAAAGIALTDAEKALRKKDYLEIFYDEIGSFESKRAKRIIIEKDEED